MEDVLRIRAVVFKSRLWIGTGKYKDFKETRKVIEASGADVVTVAAGGAGTVESTEKPLRNSKRGEEHDKD